MSWTLADDHQDTGWYVNTRTDEQMRIEVALIGGGPMYRWQLVHVDPFGSKFVLKRSEILIEDTHPECRLEDAITAEKALSELQLEVGKILGLI
jgi:hypothetical protein